MLQGIPFITHDICNVPPLPEYIIKYRVDSLYQLLDYQDDKTMSLLYRYDNLNAYKFQNNNNFGRHITIDVHKPYVYGDIQEYMKASNKFYRIMYSD